MARRGAEAALTAPLPALFSAWTVNVYPASELLAVKLAVRTVPATIWVWVVPPPPLMVT